MVEAAVSTQRSGKRGKLLLVWSILLVLLVAIGYTQLQRKQIEQAEADAPYDRSRMVLPIELDELGAIEIAALGGLHRFEKDAQGLWFYHGAHGAGAATDQHVPDAATSKLITDRLNGLERAKLEREVKLDKSLKDYGLANPETLLLVYRAKESQPVAQFAFGDIAPDTVSQYAMRIGANEAWTLPSYHVENLVGLVRAVQPKPAEPSK